MIHATSLQDRPADFQVPSSLSERFWYDEERRQLCFDGFMSKATYDRLETLSPEGAYQTALEQLFRVCVPENKARMQSGNRGALAVSAFIGFVAVASMAAYLMLAY